MSDVTTEPGDGSVQEGRLKDGTGRARFDAGGDRCRVAVVVPNHNHAGFLQDCLDGIAGQTRAPDEVVVVDDASTDHSLDVLTGAGDSLPQLRVVRQCEQRGVNPTINRALAEVRSDLVVVTAADDRLLPAFLERAAGMLEVNPGAAICSGRSLIIDASGDRVGELRLTPIGPGDRYLTAAEAREFAHRFGGWMTTNVTMFRRRELQAAGGFHDEMGSYGDAFVALELACLHGACFVDAPFGEWRRSDFGYMAASMRDSAAVARTIDAVHERLEYLQCEGLPRDLSLRWERRLRYAMAATALRSKRADAASLVAVLDAVRAPMAGILGAACRVRSWRGLVPLALFATLRPFDVPWRLLDQLRGWSGLRPRGQAGACGK